MIDAFDYASLEAFVAELVAAGFEPVTGSAHPRWRGSVHPAFAPLTHAETMDLVLLDGWPFEPPALLVEGLDTNHSMLGGLVCLWRDDDASLRWTTVEGLFSRIEEWCHDAQHGWNHDDLGRDARLNFARELGVLATFDLPSLGTSRGGWGELHGVVATDPLRVGLVPGSATLPSDLHGLWFRVGEVKVPPRQLSELRRCLFRPQWRGLERALARRRSGNALVPSGGVDFIVFCWERGTQLDLLIMACEGFGDSVEAMALQPGPNDEQSLILRAGPDAPMLRSHRATVFGLGALGGHVAVTLAESGLGFLDLVDADVLAPGNVVRHVAGHDRVGDDKVRAVERVVRNHAPWTTVSCHCESPQTPSGIQARINDADIVVDATGNAAVTLALAAVTRTAGKPLVSGALYRGGFLSRVRRQGPDDVSLDQRTEVSRYPVIPPDLDGSGIAIPGFGCSAPVNNASPVSVLACSSLLAHAAIDVLTGRFELEDEVIDVYRPLAGIPPFEHVGRVDRSSCTSDSSFGGLTEITVPGS